MRNFSTLFPCIRVVHQTCANQWTKASSKLLTHKIFYPVVRSTSLQMFCQATGLGGKAERIDEKTQVENLKKVSERNIVVRFNADVASSMQWNFRPQQTSVKVIPGETALAFYTAKNPTDKAIIGISTYNVIPYEAGLYFNKIQCFCFEEQRLNPHEQYFIFTLSCLLCSFSSCSCL
ncbi:COX11 [Acanthosepion pharaonis]|uniref:Cytochrome c oxidase assembly protein COX11, mitochondrial n=1 Tax=Acanthosepion pharaonis TaxID=158019 RepID=A0A812EQI7_ACAPH|nr:COX11 [Sepia pharaonis]